MPSRIQDPESDRNSLTRQTLLMRLKNWNDDASWQEFFDAYWRLIHSVAIRAGLNEEEAQDVVQETILSVAKKMEGFQYDRKKGSFRSWLFQITRRRIVDRFRKRARELPQRVSRAREKDETATLDRIPDPSENDLESRWNEEFEQHLMDAVLQKVRRCAEPIEYQIYDLHVVKGWPVKKVAAKLRVKSARVYFVKYEVSNLIKKEVERLQS